MVEDSEAIGRKDPWLHMEFFKEHIELEFIPKKFNCISTCKLRVLVNATNDNLCQYLKTYSELMFEIWHMHELDHVCHFVMGLPT
jgi:hypothetical protein